MDINELIADLKTRINPSYADQRGTESYERRQCVEALLDAQVRIAELGGALERAREMVSDWGTYAPEYFKQKHNLAGDLAWLDGRIGKGKE